MSLAFLACLIFAVVALGFAEQVSSSSGGVAPSGGEPGSGENTDGAAPAAGDTKGDYDWGGDDEYERDADAPPESESQEAAATTEEVSDSTATGWEPDDEALNIARDFAIPDSEVRKYPSAEAFQMDVLRRSRALLNMLSQQPIQQQPDVPVVDEPAFELPDLSDFDPKLADAIKGMKQHFEKSLNTKVDGVRNHYEQLEAQRAQEHTQREAARIEGEFDEALGSMDQYSHLFGKDKTSALNPKSKEYANRQKLAEAMASIGNGLRASGKSLPPVKLLVMKAIGMEFMDELMSVNRAELNGKLKKRANGAVAVPTRRKETVAQMSPERRAAENVGKFFQDRKLTLGNDDEFDDSSDDYA
mgnify:CR=1 FL=1